MSWQRRLRDMALAGGAGLLTATGCSSGTGAGPGDAGADADPFCCNLNSDPCCPSLNCGAPVTAECTAKIACVADGEVWDYSRQSCTTDAGTHDSGSDVPDTGLIDAASDAQDAGPIDAAPDVAPFCCNANADPCCVSTFCGEPVTAECTAKMACEADGGTWDYGHRACASDAGPADATFDAPDMGPIDAASDAYGQPD